VRAKLHVRRFIHCASYPEIPQTKSFLQPLLSLVPRSLLSSFAHFSEVFHWFSRCFDLSSSVAWEIPPHEVSLPISLRSATRVLGPSLGLRIAFPKHRPKLNGTDRLFLYVRAPYLDAQGAFLQRDGSADSEDLPDTSVKCCAERESFGHMDQSTLFNSREHGYCARRSSSD